MAPHLVASRRRRNQIGPKRVASVTDEQILAHRPLIRRMAHYYRKKAPYRIDLDDLIQVGWCGFLAGMQRYDPTRGVTLGAFCTLWVRGALHRSIFKQRSLWEATVSHLKLARHSNSDEVDNDPEAKPESDSLRLVVDDLLDMLPDREQMIVAAIHRDGQQPGKVARDWGMLLADVIRISDESLAWLRIVGE